ncbi:hypothetical protein [Rufibacter hautae]|uniref:Uncharacterized protein n=1 Tax=Rufibacter hautae TaxID=2595005 RepID=A0A5B6TMX2_9BACT|nr:hypothetical protein [Rufibacter hautae]KAA3437663.1 hypothetical protein FOA19_10170 [Rufibacter hautae]
MGLFDFFKSDNNKKLLNYEFACKTCLKTDGMRHKILIADSYSDFYENRLMKSEYQFQTIIKDYLKKNKKSCPNCKSYNLEISDIEFDSKNALVGRRIDQIQLVLMKHENGQIEIQTGGTQYLPTGFLKEAFKIIESVLLDTDKTEFEEKKIGNVRFVVSTRFIENDDYRTSRLEQFKFVGFDKETIVRAVTQIKGQMVK